MQVKKIKCLSKKKNPHFTTQLHITWKEASAAKRGSNINIWKAQPFPWINSIEVPAVTAVKRLRKKTVHKVSLSG